MDEKHRQSLEVLGKQYETLSGSAQYYIDKIAVAVNIQKGFAAFMQQLPQLVNGMANIGPLLGAGVEMNHLSEGIPRVTKTPVDKIGGLFKNEPGGMDRKLFEGLANGGSMQRFWDEFVGQGRQSLMRLGWEQVLKPQLSGLFDTLKAGLNASLQGITITAGLILNAAQGLIAAMSGGKRGFGAIFGGVLGGIAALATGGAVLPFISTGAGLGSAFAGGNPTEILMAGAGAYQSYKAGNFASAAPTSKGFEYAGYGNYGPPKVEQTVNVYGGINNAADYDKLTSDFAKNTARALRE